MLCRKAENGSCEPTWPMLQNALTAETPEERSFADPFFGYLVTD